MTVSLIAEKTTPPAAGARMSDTAQDCGRVIVCGSSAAYVVEREELARADVWCFTCRTRRDFMARMYAVPEPEYMRAIKENEWACVWMTPFWRVECSHCNTIDGDLGFGRYRTRADA